MPGDLRIFDGHNDVVSKLLDDERDEMRSLGTTGRPGGTRSFFQRSDQGHIDLPRALEIGYAQRTAIAQLGVLYRLQRQSEGQVRVVRDVAALQACLRAGGLAAVIHFEGAEAIDPRLD